MSGTKVGVRPSAALTRLSSNVFDAPSFTQSLEAQITVAEGDSTRLATQVHPAADSSLAVEWYKDGKPLGAGSRFVTMFDRGYCVLDFLYTVEEDSGSYSCVAISNFGSTQSSTCAITVVPEAAIDYNTQEQIQAQTGTFTQSEPVPQSQPTSSPKFVKNLVGGGQLNQSQPTRLEAFVEPPNDATLTIDWLRDGKPVVIGSRFNSVYDRGYCLLEVLCCYPEDSGMYTCLAKNSLGETQSNPVEIICYPDESIVTKSNLPEESISHLKQLDLQDLPGSGAEFRYQEERESECAPEMATPLQNTQAIENGPAKFFVRINGTPRPEVAWFINDVEVVPDSIIKASRDGAINYLEIVRCSEVGEFQIKVTAKNNLGQIEGKSILQVVPSDFNVPELKHITPDPYTNPFKKMQSLKKVECTDELSKAFKKPKPTAEHIVNMERGVELKGRHTKSADVLETEKLYDNVAAKLKKPNSGIANWGQQSTEAAFSIQLTE